MYKNFSKKIIVLLLILLPFFSFASTCSKSGYTVFTINGIMTDEKGARLNMLVLKDKSPEFFNNQEVKFKYLYNPSHLAGVADVVDVLYQGLTNEKSNYDSVEIWSDASKKLDTQKVLLLGHSQGNFYANGLYEDIAGKVGGTPIESIGVYSVATPASYVAGGGAYLTSSSDRVITEVASRALGGKVLKANTDIQLQKGDDINGHSFSDIYLKYKGQEIVSGIKTSLSKLENNNTQDEDQACITEPVRSFAHKLEGVQLAAADLGVKAMVNTSVYAYKFGNTILTALDYAGTTFNNYFNNLASFIPNIKEANMASVVPFSTTENMLDVEVVENPTPLPTNQNNTVEKEVKKVVKVEQDIKIKDDPKDKVKSITESLIPEITLPSLFTLASGGPRGMQNPGTTSVVEEIIKEVVKIIPDETPPTITLYGPSLFYFQRGDTYVDPGATAIDAIDGEVDVSVEGVVDDQTLGVYTLLYTASDTKGNKSTMTRTVKVVPLLYVDSDFGLHSDGTNWQMWHFNGSQIYDWHNSYIDGYLHQQFKMYVPKSSGYCSICFSGGIFDVNPYEGYDMSQVHMMSLEENKQNSGSGYTYDVSFTFDSGGYTTIFSHDGIVDSSIYREVQNANTKYVGYTMSSTPFRSYYTTGYIGPQRSEFFYTNGAMFMTTHAMSVYKEVDSSDLYTDKSGRYISGAYPNYGRSNLTEFSFKIHSSIGTPVLHIDGRDISMVQDIGDTYKVDKLKLPKGSYAFYFSVGDTRTDEENLHVADSEYVFGNKYTFGIDELGRVWDVWAFNGSNIYDWVDEYVDGYLHEQFKVYKTGYGYCNSCLQRGVFTHDPTYGFEGSELSISNLEWNSQEGGLVDIYWDNTGYTASLTVDGIVKYSIHTDVANTDSVYVAWDNSHNNFRNFPSGNYYGDINMGDNRILTGGANMLVLPMKVKE